MSASGAKTLAWVGFVVVLIGTALPWAHVKRHVQRVEIRQAHLSGFQESTVGGFSMPGYRSSATVQGFSLPGWLVIVMSLVCAIVTSRPRASFSIPLMLCGYGLLHGGFMFLALLNTPNMGPSYGIAIVLAGFSTQLAGVIVKDRKSKGGPPARV